MGHAHARRPPKASARDSSLRGGDGAESEIRSISDVPADCLTPLESVIWVDLFDPINGQSFKPSPLKPIPLFMQRPRASIIESQYQPSADVGHLQKPPLKNPVSGTSTVCPTPPASTDWTSRPTTPRPLASRPSTPHASAARPPTPLRARISTSSRESSLEYFGDIGPLDLGRKPTFAVVREEPLKRPSSRLAASRQRSDARSSAYQTPPEYPEPLSNPSYPRPLSVFRPISPLPSQLTSHSHRVVHTAPRQSSEYLERYRPIMTPGIRRPPALTEPTNRMRIRKSLEHELEEGTIGEEVEDDASGSVDDGRGWGKVRVVGAELRRFFAGR